MATDTQDKAELSILVHLAEYAKSGKNYYNYYFIQLHTY